MPYSYISVNDPDTFEECWGYLYDRLPEDVRDLYEAKLYELVVLYTIGKERAPQQRKAHNRERDRINTRLKRAVSAKERLLAVIELGELPDAPKKTTATKKHIEELLKNMREDYLESRYGRVARRLLTSV